MTDELMEEIRMRVKMDDARYGQVDQLFNDLLKIAGMKPDPSPMSLRPQAEQDRAALLKECDRLRRLLDRETR
jgi:hypothetical protein